MTGDPFERILGRSRAADSIRAFGRRAASVNAPVLLMGESGTGKGVLARAIHDASARSRAPFVSVNCAAIPDSLFESEFFGHVRGAFTGAQYAHKGLFEQAHGGTLFLDEVGELPLTAQAKLLTCIEDRIVRRVGGERTASVDSRMIAATATDLAASVTLRGFRRDLYHRLRVLHFTIPPLRVRHGDIVILAEMLLDRYAKQYTRHDLHFAAGAVAFLEQHHWPGNVRELAHAIECAVVACDDACITGFGLDAPVATGVTALTDGGGRKVRYSFAGTPDEERRIIELAIRRCNGNKTRAAAELGMSRNTLLNKLRAPLLSS